MTKIMEKIKIENFAGIKSMDLEFKSINILIGPQGSGKSITVKLLYFFKSFFNEIIQSIDSDETKRELDKKQKEKFITFFPKDTWPKGNFKITYTVENTIIFVERRLNNQINFDYSESLKKIINKARKVSSAEKKRISEDPKRATYSFKRQLDERLEEHFKQEVSPESMYSQFFIPAGRSFFANIQKNIFSFLSDNRSLDPFLIEFGSFYEGLKRFYTRETNVEKTDKEFDDIIFQILNSKYQREKEKDFLVHNDHRKVNLSNASSGQQETLPLVVILKVLNELQSDYGATIYIEEPEAHLFPIAQKAMVKLLARTFNSKNSKFQIIVTTHSPYILASFNNLLQAGRLSKLKPDEEKNISKIVSKQEQISPDLLSAYSLNLGKKVDLIDDESKLISQTILDSVSNEISIEFGNLLDIEF